MGVPKKNFLARKGRKREPEPRDCKKPANGGNTQGTSQVPRKGNQKCTRAKEKQARTTMVAADTDEQCHAINKGINGGDLSAIAYAIIPCLTISCGVGKHTRCNQPIFKHRRRRTHSECGAGGKTDILNHRVEAAKGIAVDRGDQITYV
jgi:hypothetical protein